jgi:hypothetical protein
MVLILSFWTADAATDNKMKKRKRVLEAREDNMMRLQRFSCENRIYEKKRTCKKCTAKAILNESSQEAEIEARFEALRFIIMLY